MRQERRRRQAAGGQYRPRHTTALGVELAVRAAATVPFSGGAASTTGPCRIDGVLRRVIELMSERVGRGPRNRQADTFERHN